MRTSKESLREYARGVVGGLIFSLPLLYTMEVWWAGFTASPWRLAVYVLATFVLLLGYNYFGGLRRDDCFREVVIDSVEEMGIGLLVAFCILWLLGRVTTEMPAAEAVGKTVVEGMTVAIGVSVGTAQLGGGGKEDEGVSGDDGAGFGAQVVIAFCGAVLFAANVAPTEEIIVIATEISVWRLLGLSALSMALAALVLYYSEFAGADKYVLFDRHHDVAFGTIITYAVALTSSALILWFFGRFDGQALATCVAQTVVLGVAATLGASAGRLLVQ
ncbi:MAG: TIGR02587 family membrane protein [Acidobacteria bacterium]|nr:TIGR02587 family membrane protein [Acidobacteriota bacterium]MCA1642196.1 TIGR02587 family membrane protein [Acidobacteriota bacterium]